MATTDRRSRLDRILAHSPHIVIKPYDEVLKHLRKGTIAAIKSYKGSPDANQKAVKDLDAVVRSWGEEHYQELLS